MICKQWDIVLISFPFTNLRGKKKRPALIISPDLYNEEGMDVIIAFLTSNITPENQHGDYRLKNWKLAGLPKPTKFKLKMATIIKTKVVKILRQLNSFDQNNIKKILIKSIQGKL
jgi:mRNA interferase MazF